VAADRAHVAMGLGSINKSSHILFICQTLYPDQLLVPARLVRFARNYGLSALGEGLCVSLSANCLLGLQCVPTTMSKGSGHTGGRGPNRGGS
jgi:hypothetical protein